jgi:hypothetical protein
MWLLVRLFRIPARVLCRVCLQLDMEELNRSLSKFGLMRCLIS